MFQIFLFEKKYFKIKIQHMQNLCKKIIENYFLFFVKVYGDILC